MILSIAIFLVVLGSSQGTDPSACQHTIKFMLINACGATKREYHHLPHYMVMSKQEVEERYCEMVKANMIKGVQYPFDEDLIPLEDDNNLTDSDDYLSDDTFLNRFKRSFLGLFNVKTISDPIIHEQRGGFQFIGQLPTEERAPAPGALKAKCCKDIYLCTLDDFKGFCG